ncbi:uncharacterized protein isoform X1 [Rhodnius prolixus]|uniref:uncharacterized protein isoform X1 n=1 Tax=Rhodnius prolixus TaxID=13249 RepID=UPI003D187E54
MARVRTSLEQSRKLFKSIFADILCSNESYIQQKKYVADLDFIGQLNNVALIKEIKKYPCLYDLDKEEYRDINIKEDCWIRISNKLNEDVSKIKNDWKKLRDCYRLLRQNGQTTNNLKGWQYQKELEFLRPCVATGTLKNDFLNLTNNNLNKDEFIRKIEKFDNILLHEQSPNNFNKTTNFKHFNETADQVISCIKTKLKTNDDEDNRDIDLFFNSMCETTKKLPKLYQNQIKRKLFEAVLSAEHQIEVDKMDSKCKIRNSVCEF